MLAAIFAASAVNAAYLPLWLADHGLTAAEIGLVLGVASLLRVVAAPGGGWLADRLGRRRAVLAGSAALAAACAAGLPAAHGLAPLMLIVTAAGLSASLLGPLTDALALALAAARRLEYAPTRAWGSISYMLTTAGAGAVLARLGSGAVPAMLAAGYAAAAAFACRLPDVSAGRRRAGISGGLWTDRRFRLSLAATALIQGSHAAYYSFAPLHWRTAGLGDTTIGLLIAEGIVAEILLFLRGQRLVRRLGPAGLTALAASACVVRWAGFAVTTAVPALMALQLLHAMTFAFQHLSSMLVLAQLPPERAGMAQTLTSALGFSAASAALVWLTGQLYGPWGGLSFLPMAAIGGAALLTVPGLTRLADRSRA